MAAHRLTYRPVRLRQFAPLLGCDLLKGIGYTWQCSCGERGPILRELREARDAGRSHVVTAENPESGHATDP